MPKTTKMIVIVGLILSLVILCTAVAFAVSFFSGNAPENADTNADTSLDTEDDTEDDTETDTKPEFTLEPEPEFLVPAGMGTDIERYEGYLSTVKVTLESDSYKISTASNYKIAITISVKGDQQFDFWHLEGIQKLDEESGMWKTLKYEPPELYHDSNWSTFTKGMEFETYFRPYYMKENLTPGTYRFLVFIDEYTFPSPEFTFCE